MFESNSELQSLPENQVDKLKRNDAEALRHLYLTNYKGIETYILKNSGTRDDAKDIYQEAFIAVWRNVQLDKVSFDRDTDKLNGYLFRVAQYKWLDELRRRDKKRNRNP